MIDLRPLGDRAFLARFPDESSARGWAEGVRRRAIPGVMEVAVAYASAAVYVDPDGVDFDGLASVIGSIDPAPTGPDAGRLIRIPVLYDGEDLAEVAVMVGLPESGVIDRHRSVEYSVYALGFLPGFPYAGYLPAPLAGIPRRDSPRAKVPAGSVAVAGRQTGIYPSESPGGWRLLGRTPLRVVDPSRSFFPIRPGDRLRFEPIDEPEYRARLGEPVGLDE